MKSARQDTGRSAGREALLLAALPHVAFDGWTAAALQTGAADAGIPPEDIKRLFPGGAEGLAWGVGQWTDGPMDRFFRMSSPWPWLK